MPWLESNVISFRYLFLWWLSVKPPLNFSCTGSSMEDNQIVNKKKRKKKVKQATIEEIEVPEDEPPSGIYKKSSQQKEATGRIPDHTNITMTSSERKKMSDLGRTASNSGVSDAKQGAMTDVKAHRRAISLGSSEIVRHKRDVYGIDQDPSSNFEVPSCSRKDKSEQDFGKTESTKYTSFDDMKNGSDNVTSKNENDNLKREISRSESIDHDDSVENSDYTNILSKLATLSTSFKSSFTTGFLQRGPSKDKEDPSQVSDPVNAQFQIKTEGLSIGKKDDDDVASLVEDDNNSFMRTAKLEVSEEVVGDTPTDSPKKTNDAQPELSGKLPVEGAKQHKSLATSLSTPIPVKPQNEASLISQSQDDAVLGNQTANDYFEKVLAKGDSLTPREFALDTDKVEALRTPPPTPADSFIRDRTYDISSKEGSTSLESSGLEQKLSDLEQKEIAEAKSEISTGVDEMVSNIQDTKNRGLEADRTNTIKNERANTMDDSESASINSR